MKKILSIIACVLVATVIYAGTTTNFNWNYGIKGQSPWWDTWTTIFQAIDTEVYALKLKLLGYDDARRYASINAAVTAIGSTQTTLKVSNAQTLTANLIIPSTLCLDPIKGGIITLGDFNLTINGPFDAGFSRCFIQNGAGRVTFGAGAVKEAYSEWWGAKGDDATDNATAINYAIEALGSTSYGGILQFLDGIYRYSTYLNLNAKRNILLRGTKHNTGAAPLGVELKYIGADTPAINAGTSYGIRFEKLTLSYTNAAFAGHLLYLAGSEALSTQEAMISECSLYGSGVRGAISLVYLNRVISSAIKDSLFANADVAIMGALNHSNIINIERNRFTNMTTAHIKDYGEAWNIKGNTFNSLYNAGDVGKAGAITHTSSGLLGRSVNIEGNWFGDIADPNTGTWIKFSGSGFRFVGNLMGLTTGATGIEFDENSTRAVEISGNTFYRAGLGGANPICIKITGSNLGAMQIGPNFLWESVAGNLTELSGTLPDGSIFQETDYLGGGKIKIGNVYPATNDTYYLGKNDDDTPFAWKGVILRDTTNGNYYRIEVINGVITATNLAD